MCGVGWGGRSPEKGALACKGGEGGSRKIISQLELVNERNKLAKLIFQGILV